ncbi:MAG: rhodanese-like domain-containing protein [Candidatus Marinarcus sp.]|uniref:rhodanese-like domain-containing protein n=1 Tax=Candidatus Marinarcus sp. TaxID=3100987 RepID=UPI003B00E232
MKKFLSVLCFTALFSTTLFAEFKAYNVQELQESINAGIKVIDIRDAKQWEETGTIPTSYTITFSDKNDTLAVKKWMYKFNRIVKNKQQPFVLVSQDSAKSEDVGKFLNKTYGYKNIYYLKGGISSWTNDKKTVVK